MLLAFRRGAGSRLGAALPRLPPLPSHAAAARLSTAQPLPPGPSFLKVLNIFLITTLGGFGTYAYTKDEGLWRYLTAISKLLPMACDYQLATYVNTPLKTFHDKWAETPAAVCAEMGGFYIKVGQFLAITPSLLPPSYLPSLNKLQCSVLDAIPFSSIKETLVSDLGCPLSMVFSTIEEAPIATAAIGQVHRATLLDGTYVVVKVQTRDEKVYRGDFDAIKRIVGMINATIGAVLEKQEEMFRGEFDYVEEGKNGTLVFGSVGGKGPVAVPQPYDFAHPNYPAALLSSKTPLITKHVLVTDECHGTPLPYLAAPIPSPLSSTLLQALYTLHGTLLLSHGLINADPHPGNVLYDASREKLSLVDFGQLVPVEAQFREDFARLIVAVEEGDVKTCGAAFLKCGNKVVVKGGEVGEVEAGGAVAMIHFGGERGRKKGEDVLGFGGDEMGKLLTIEESNPQYGMLQRACFCLGGVGEYMQVEGGGSHAAMLAPSAREYLAKQKKSLTYERDV